MSVRQQLLIDDNNDNEPCCGSFLDFLGSFFGCCCCITSCGCCCNPYKTINRGTRGVITRFGSVKHIVNDGLHYVNPITESINVVELMVHVKKLCNQTVITKNKLPVTIDGVVYYRIGSDDESVLASRFGIVNLSVAVDELSHATLRNIIGAHTLQECLENRKELATLIQNSVNEKCKVWGVTIQDIEIIDITIPPHIQQMLSSSATAESEAQAKLILAKADVQSAHMLREAADQLNTPSAMQIRLLDTYRMIAESENAKIIFLPASATTGLDNLTANMIGSALDKK